MSSDSNEKHQIGKVANVERSFSEFRLPLLYSEQCESWYENALASESACASRMSYTSFEKKFYVQIQETY